MMSAEFERRFQLMPLMAILRGLGPHEAVAIGEAIVAAGITLLEVPLNSPEPLTSIGLLVRALAGRALVGAGTVMTATQAQQVADIGGGMIISPNSDARVIDKARQLGLVSLPGCFTPSEAVSALEAGAHGLKLFPGELVTPASARALAAILPPATRLILVGGVSVEVLPRWKGGAVHGFGIGSALYKPGLDVHDVGQRAHAFVKAWQTA